MLRRRRVFSVAPLWQDGRPAESCVVLTSVSTYRKLPGAQPQSSLSLDLQEKMSKAGDRWAEAGSSTHSTSPQLDFLPVGGRLLKSESEDSGVEMASNDHSPSTPVGSEKSFSLDCLDGFQLSMEDKPPLSPLESGPQGVKLEEPEPTPDRAYRRNLSVSKKLAQVVQRSQKHRLPSRSPRQFSQRPLSLADLEGLKLHRMASVDGVLDAAACGGRPAISAWDPLEKQKVEEEAQMMASLPMPGQGLRYLEHICQMLEKIAQLQRANQQLQHQRQVLECRIRAQELENEGFSEEGPLDSEPPQTTPQPSSPAAEAIEEEENPRLMEAWTPHRFRTHSASDMRTSRSHVRNQGKKAELSRNTTAHSASSPSLLDQPDGISHTLPPGMKLKNGHSHWSKVKVLINRMTRKSTPDGELPLSGDAASRSRHSRADIVLDKQGTYAKRHFLPTLVVKKHRLKHLSMG